VIETRFRKARFSVFEADFERHELRKHGVRIKLTEQPFQALTLLLENAGEVVTRERFRETLWPNESWGEHDQRLNRIVNKIREALCDSADTPRFVETVPRVGYRFLVDVNGLEAAEAEIAARANALPPDQEPAQDSAPALTARPAPPADEGRFIRQPWTLFGSVLITCVLLAGISNRVASTPHERVQALQPVPLTTYVGSELYPSLSPDGTRVAFAWDGEAKSAYHIYTASTSGGGAHQITAASASDAAPVWSPDGKQIAFLRGAAPGMAQLWTVRADGSNPVKVREIRSTALNPSLTWTHDQKWLIVSQKCQGNGVPALFRISATTGEETQITSASAGQFAGDMSPTVSADGSRLAFTRSTSPSWRDVFVVHLSKDSVPEGNAVQLTNKRSDIDYVAWAPDGKFLVFSAAAMISAPHHLFRVEANAAGTRPEITELGIEGDRPTLAGTPFKLAYVRTNIEQSSVWRLDRDATQTKKSRVMASTRRDFTTALSPDGEQIVFSSIRSGQTEVWISQTDGSNVRRLTSIGGSEPRWSPDGKRIAFVSSQFGESDIYVLKLETGAIQRLTSEGSSHLKPSWSRDGRFIYFCSDRTGRPQIWKLPGEGGDPVQITRHGGLYAVEAFDEKSIYYTTADIPAEVWLTSVNGGEETPVLRNVLGHASIAMSRDGLYYLSNASASRVRLDFFRFADHANQTLSSIDYPVHAFLSSSSDGRSVLYSQVDSQDRDLMLVDPYR
jgi:Tol biopolymer transport system component/DNA-binding winged helix-turn-helix (wHTH) protein